jgi:hypothetical protein
VRGWVRIKEQTSQMHMFRRHWITSQRTAQPLSGYTRSHPQPPVTSATPFSNGVPPVYIHPSMSSDWRHPSVSTRKFLVEMGNLRTLFQVMVRSEKHQIIDHGWFSGILNPSPNFAEAVRRPGALEAIVSYIYAHPSAPTH